MDMDGGLANKIVLAAMLCINVLHISPWKVAQNLFAGAGRYLRDGGRLFVYGPFKREASTPRQAMQLSIKSARGKSRMGRA